MIRQTQDELKARSEAKTLDQALLAQLRDGFGCSPFESHAILETVQEIYLGRLRSPTTLKPGQMVTMAIRADEPPGKPLKECQFVPIVVTVHTAEDERLRQAGGRQGVACVRRAQIERVAWEAVAQESYLTVEDLAYRILNCGPRTIEQDLADLRSEDKEIPLRGQQMDMGRGVTHKKLAVRLYLERKTYSEIKKRIHHSYRAIQRYVEDFVAVAMMTTAEQSLFEISFLRRISPTLVREYQALYDTYNVNPYRERLAEVIAQFQCSASPSDAEKGGANK